MPIVVMSNGVANEGKSKELQINGQGTNHREVLLEGHHTHGNGVLRNGVDFTAESSSAIEQGAMTSLKKPPPEIEHITQGYQPVSKLITRLSQDTLKELGEVITNMANISSQQQQPVNFNHNASTNGNSGATPQANLDKKMLLMDFVQKRRAQFIKVLVLTQWSRQSEKVSKLIDLKVWLGSQAKLYDEAAFWMGDLRRSLDGAKLPNPDLKTALEILSTGKASWMPELIYVPSDPLSPQEVLKGLSSINTLLLIRLNLHESIPAYFKDYTVSSGRATFTVPNEFQVDISIGSDNPETPLFFVDFRFIFSPAVSEVPEGQFWEEIAARSNHALELKGLSGLYSYLHEMVLTYKINILRRQAIDMSRGPWTEAIRIEMHWRRLIVQYWAGRPGKKHWVEIGVHSGQIKDSKGVIKKQRQSFLSLQWVRDGERVVEPVALDLNSGALSMESIINHIVGLHVKQILIFLRSRLLDSLLYSQRALSHHLTLSTDKPVDSTLKIQLTANKLISISIQPMTGSFALEPASQLSVRAESELNSYPIAANRAPQSLANFRGLVVITELESRAASLGWRVLETPNIKHEELKRVFPRDTLRLSYFKLPGWGPHWLLAFSVGKHSEDWWILEINDNDKGHSITDSQHLSMSNPSGQIVDHDYTFLSRLAVGSAGICSQFVNCRALRAAKVKYELRLPSGKLELRAPRMHVQYWTLIKSRSLKGFGLKDNVFPRVAIGYQGLTGDGGEALIITQAAIKTPTDFSGIVTESIDNDIAFNQYTGVFSFTLHTPVGQSVVEKVVERLGRIERLQHFMRVIRQHSLRCSSVSLTRIDFTYSQNPPLSAQVFFDGDYPMRLSFAKGNPHLYIVDHLSRFLNADGGFDHIVRLLAVTLPVCRALEAIERDSQNIGQVGIMPRSADMILLRYHNSGVAFDLRLRHRQDNLLWTLKEYDDEKRDPGASRQDKMSALAAEIKIYFSKSGAGFKGFRTSIMAEVEAIEEVIKGLHVLVKKHGFSEKTEDEPPEVIALD